MIILNSDEFSVHFLNNNFCSKKVSQEQLVSAQPTGAHDDGIMIILLSLSLLTTGQALHTLPHVRVLYA